MLVEFGRRDAFKEKLLDFATKIFFRIFSHFPQAHSIICISPLTHHICRKGPHVQF